MALALFTVFFVPAWPAAAAGILVAWGCGVEHASFFGRDWRNAPLLGAATVGLAFALVMTRPESSLLIAGLGVATAVGAWMAARLDRDNVTRWKMELASLWYGAPIAALLYLREISIPDTAKWFFFISPLLLALVPVWAGDTAAIVVGKALGRRPLAPDISPKKTLEGAAGNLVAAALIGIPIAMWVGVPPSLGLVCGALCGVLGQAGDLFESWIKRRAGVKDSGSILPGHGGLLDRIDSMLFSTPPVVLAILLWPGHISG